MQLDQTRIGIRERSLLEIMDLALQVIRRHFVAWLVISVVMSVLPVVGGMYLFFDFDLEEMYSERDWANLWVYVMFTAWFASLFLPLVEMPLTVYLGQALFIERPSWRVVVGNCLRSLPQMILLQLVFRGIVSLACVTAVIPYAMWPYLSEVILLERNPLFGGRRKVMTTLKRSGNLHRRSGGNLFGRWISGLAVCLVLAPAMWLGLWLFVGLFAGITSMSLFGMVLVGNITGWLLISYFTVVRYLSYLDLRIRSEGWEIELAMRAEGERLTRQLA